MKRAYEANHAGTCDGLELEGRILRVVTLEDRLTIHNAFPDRGFKR